jgi:glycosyltransferase involved in cell wall biosynthesis
MKMTPLSRAKAKPFWLVVVETHPIQYKAPLFRRMAQDPHLDLTVLYAMIPTASQQGAGFGVAFEWDRPLLEGYNYEVLENRAKVPSQSVFSGCDTPGIYAWLRRDRPDAVLVNGWVAKTCIQALVACRRLGIPCLVRGEANLLRPRVAWKHVVHRVLLRQYSAYLAIGRANLDFYRFHGCPADRLFFAPYAVDNEYFSGQAELRSARRHEIRASLGVPDKVCLFLFAGKLENKKHPLDIIEAVSGMSGNQRAGIHVLMAGSGPLQAECETHVRAMNLPVTFAGFLNQSRLPDAYTAADALILPSDAGETWGLVVNEAMASGLPAIVSDHVGCQGDLVEEGVTGYSFPLGNVQALADLMIRMAGDAEGRKAMSARARGKVALYSYECVIRGIINALNCVVGKTGAE